MAQEMRSYEVTIPAGTAKDAPITVDTSFPVRQVAEVQVIVPPGPSGEMGFAVACSGLPILPLNSGEWIVTDDEVIPIPTDGYPDSGSWQIIGYNTGRYDHSLWVRFYLNQVSTPAPADVPIPADLLTSDATAGG